METRQISDTDIQRNTKPTVLVPLELGANIVLPSLRLGCLLGKQLKYLSGRNP